MTAMIDASYAPAPAGWSSRSMFILAAVGSAVGLGNIWKFPYIVGENGGGAFVLVYLGCLVLFGLPILIAEITLGRSGGDKPGGAFLTIARRRRLSPHWRRLGELGALAALLILFFYTVVAGWVGLYAFDYAMAAAGYAAPIGDAAAHFTATIAAPREQFAAIAFILAAGFALVACRAVRGVEVGMLVMAPLFVALLAVLAAVAVSAHPEPLSIVAYLLTPDFSALTPGAIAEAIGHAFFTLSIGMCSMIVYGAYLGPQARTPQLGAVIAFADTAISMTAAFIVFGIAFAAGADPTQGPGLIFVVLPKAFDMMPAGNLIAVAFFIAVFMAAFSSVIALLIVVTRAIEEALSVGTPAAAAMCSLLVFGGGSLVIASNCGLIRIDVLGATLFDALDRTTSVFLLPAVGLGVAVFASRALKQELGEGRFGRAILFCLRCAAPAGILIVAVAPFL